MRRFHIKIDVLSMLDGPESLCTNGRVLCVHVCVIVCVCGGQVSEVKLECHSSRCYPPCRWPGTVQLGQAGWPVDRRDFLVAVSPALDYSHTLPCLDCFLQVAAGY